MPVPEIQSNIGYLRLTVVNFDWVYSFTLSPTDPSISGLQFSVVFGFTLSNGCRRNGCSEYTEENNTAHGALLQRMRSAVWRMPQSNTKINSIRENEVYSVRQIFIELVSGDGSVKEGRLSLIYVEFVMRS